MQITMTRQTDSSPSVAMMAALWVVFATIVLYPIVSVEIPGLGDYLNHLARMHILTTIEDSPDLKRYYEVHWWPPLPEMGMDLIVPALGRLMPIYDAGRFFVAICVLLPAVGTAAIHYAVHRHASVIPLLGFFLSYNYLLSWGFLPYLFSVGLGLLLLAAWVATEHWPGWRRALTFVLPALILYFCHAYAFAGYCIAVAGFEIGRSWRARSIAIGDWAAAALQALLPAIFLYTTVLSGRPIRMAGEVGKTIYGDIDAKILAAESPFIFTADHAELGLAAIVAVAIIAGLFAGRLKLSPIIWPAAAAVGAVAIFVPETLVDY